MHEFVNKLSSEKSFMIAVKAVVVLLALFLLASTLSVLKGIGRSGTPATDTITVTGEGQATVAPDVARVSFTVQNDAATVAAAQEATTKQTNGVLEYLEEQDVEEEDVRTLSYNITPQYSYTSCPPGTLCPAYRSSQRVTGYQVSQTVQVTVRDLEEVGTILSGLGDRGVQNVTGPAFSLDDPTSGHDAARADAIAKAKDEARQLAKQLGVRLGKIVSYNESSGGYPYPMMGYGMGGDSMVRTLESKASPEIPAGENTYNATVSITYEIR